MKQNEERERAETKSEDTRRGIIQDASPPLRDVRHAASDGEVLQLFE
jgi:hypothetical protein